MDYPVFPLFSKDPASPEVVVSQEEFHAFHKIDRTLFSRLVFVLNLDVDQSFQAMCFLLLLEQYGYARNLVPNLVSSKDTFVDAVAKEVETCVHLLYNPDYVLMLLATNNNNLDSSSYIPNLFHLTGETFTLALIQENNEIFSNAMMKISNEICTRAFSDIVESAHRVNREKLMALERMKIIEDMKNLRLGVQQGNTSLQQQRNPNRFNVPSVQQSNNPNRFSVASVQQGTPNRLSVPSVQQRSPNRLSAQQVTITPPPRPRPIEEQRSVVEADDRTVFLTFSKGYRISKEEAMDFFTGIFGEVIEDIEMGKVGENDQSLYAKMVLKMECASMMEEIVSVKGKNKYTINGKHVWARKYIRKNVFSASSSSTHI